MNKETLEELKKILNKDFTTSVDVDKISEEIKDLIKKKNDKTIDIDSIKHELTEISYRNIYLLNDNSPKKESALKQKEDAINRIIDYIEEAINTKEETSLEDQVDEDLSDVAVIEELPIQRKENHGFNFEDLEASIPDKKPVESEKPLVIEDDKKEPADKNKEMLKIGDQDISFDTIVEFIKGHSGELTSKINNSTTSKDSMSNKDKIQAIKDKYKRMEELELKKVDLEERRTTILDKYESKKQELLRQLEIDTEKSLKDLDYEIESINKELKGLKK